MLHRVGQRRILGSMRGRRETKGGALFPPQRGSSLGSRTGERWWLLSTWIAATFDDGTRFALIGSISYASGG